MPENHYLITKTDLMETDDDRMTFTQGIRKDLITSLTENGTVIPSDKGAQVILLTALGDMDRTAIANKKIGSQERQGAADRMAALLIKKISQNGFNTPSGSPFEQDVIEGSYSRVEVELDTSELPMLELKPGETDVGLATRNYSEFMSDQGIEV